MLRIIAILFGVLAGIFAEVTNGQSLGSISGVVSDSATGEPLYGAEVYCRNTSYGSVTDFVGKYKIERVPPGNYILECRYAGYAVVRKEISLRSTENLHLDFTLKTQPYAMPWIIVSERKESSLLSEFNPADIEVFEIDKRTTYRNLEDVFNEIPIVRAVNRSNSKTTVQISGNSSEHTLVLVNNLPIQDSYTGAFDISAIPAEIVEGIEIYRGNASAIYGDKAIGGVINIITRKPGNEPRLEVKTGKLSFGGYQASAHLEKHFGTWSGDFSVTYNGAENNFKFENPLGITERRKNNDFRKISFFGSASRTVRERANLTVSLHHYNTEAGVPGNIYNPTPDARNREKITLLRAVYNEDSGKVKFRLSGNVDGISTVYTSPAGIYAPFHTSDLLVNKRLAVSLKADIANFIKYSAAGGLLTEHLNSKDHLRPSYSVGKHSRQTLYLRFHPRFEYKKETSTFNAGIALRRDWLKTGKNYNSGRINLSVEKHLKNMVCELSSYYANAFRVPSFSHLYWIEDIYSSGNPDLKAEKSVDRGISLGISIGSESKMQLKVSGNKNKVRNLISWRRAYGNKYIPVNVNKAKINTFDYSVSLIPLKFIKIEYSDVFIKSRNRSGEANLFNKHIPFRPVRESSLKVIFTAGKCQVSYSNSFTGKSYITEANTLWLSAYTLQDIDFSYSPIIVNDRINFSAFLKISNMTGERYSILEYHPMPGRMIYFGLSANIF